MAGGRCAGGLAALHLSFYKTTKSPKKQQRGQRSANSFSWRRRVTLGGGLVDLESAHPDWLEGFGGEYPFCYCAGCKGGCAFGVDGNRAQVGWIKTRKGRNKLNTMWIYRNPQRLLGVKRTLRFIFLGYDGNTKAQETRTTHTLEGPLWCRQHHGKGRAFHL
jgi:hypothetical protein